MGLEADGHAAWEEAVKKVKPMTLYPMHLPPLFGVWDVYVCVLHKECELNGAVSLQVKARDTGKSIYSFIVY